MTERKESIVESLNLLNIAIDDVKNTRNTMTKKGISYFRERTLERNENLLKDELKDGSW